jgi:uncharacterized protein involved in exopolysaccharide biosynthesis
VGELPAQQEANQRTLDRLQTQLQSIATTLESIRTRRSLILRQISAQESDAALSTTHVTPSRGEPSGLQQQLAERRLALATLQRLYVDTYPDVIRLKQEIAELEAHMATQEPVVQPTEGAPSPSLASRNVRRQQQEELEQIEQEEAKLRQQQASVQERIVAYEKKIAAASPRELELLVLTRDYEATRQNYDSLLARRQQAQVAENLEKRQKAEQFRILDEARFPTKPWKPNRLKILLAGMGAGLAVGAGAVVLVAYLDRTFHDPAHVEQFTALPVLATIPLLITTVEQRQQRLKRRCFGTACVLIPPAAVVAVHFLWMRLDVLFTHTLKLLPF